MPEQPAPAETPPRRRFADVAGFYLPRRWRRWFVYLPLDALLFATLLALGVAVYALRVDGAPYFTPAQPPPDVASQFAHLEGVLGEGSVSSPPDVVGGYSELCGYSTEWRPIFYMFYAMCLAERAAVEPAQRADVAAQLTRCARGVLRVPDDVVSPAALREHLEQREYDSAPIQTGYEGVVLGLRRQVAGDDLFDPAIARCADALAAWLERCLSGDAPESFWTSDHAVQVLALWLADRALGTDRSALLARWEAAMRARFLDADGLLVSEVATHPDRVVTTPCGSSVAWTVLFLADALPALARDQYEAFCEHRERRLLSLSASNEHASSWELGDTNSGPLILGFSPAATGFALCAHKLQGDPDRFTRSLRVFELFGRPGPTAAGHLHYHLGNAMGDAILLYAKIARPRR
jgi:hypothetical protein